MNTNTAMKNTFATQNKNGGRILMKLLYNTNVNIIKKSNNQVIVYISNSSKVYTILL